MARRGVLFLVVILGLTLNPNQANGEFSVCIGKTKKMINTLRSWMHHRGDDVTAQWGTPKRVYERSGGGKVLTYDYWDACKGRHTVSLITDTSDVIVDCSYDGKPCPKQ